jgi:hypothetical protein
VSGADFGLRFVAPGTPAEVAAVIADVRAWWDGDIDGPTASAGDVFTYRHEPEHRSTQRITEASPERVVWHVDDAHLSFVADPGEWIGSDIVFDLAPTDGGTAVVFTHRGLTPAAECFEACSSAWAFYIGGSLRRLLAGGS